MTQRCSIIGILEDGEQSLNHQALAALQKADVIIGDPRFIESVQAVLSTPVETRDFSGHVMQTPEWVDGYLKQGKQVVVLATGDPLCHGIGSFLVKKLGLAQCRLIPNISMFQVAFSRLGIAWQSVKISSIHTKDMGEWTQYAPLKHGLRALLKDCLTHDLISCFTSPENSPKRIAQMLKIEALDEQFQLSVASHLTTPKEKVTGWLSIDEACTQTEDFPEPNLVILKRIQTAPNPVLLGLADDYYFQRKPDKGLITKQEVRAVSLAKMQLKQDSIVWDIGAGSGSVGIEAAHLCPAGYVYAIEKNEADFAIVQQNLAQSSLHNYQIIHGKAPDGLEQWEQPDAIFIGGSGGNLSELIRLCLSRLANNGTLVMNFVTLENLNTATKTLKLISQTSSIDWHFIQMQVSRSKPILSMQRLQAENPIFLVIATLKSNDRVN